MGWLWKLIFLMIFGPPLFLVGLHMALLFLAMVLPYAVLLVVSFGAIAGVTAGITVALILRRRLPPRGKDLRHDA